MRNRLKSTLGPVLALACLYSNSASALPMIEANWPQAAATMNSAKDILAGRHHAAEPKVELLPEHADDGTYPAAVWVFPQAADRTFPMTNVTVAQCDAFQRFIDDRNILLTGISEVYKDGLDLALQATKYELSYGTFSDANRAALKKANESDLLLQGLQTTLELLRGNRTDLTSLIDDRNNGPARKAIADHVAALKKEAKDGIPDTPAAKLLQTQIDTLKLEIDDLNTKIDNETDEDKIAALEAQVRLKRKDKKDKQTALDALAATYRQQKAQEATDVENNELKPYDAVTKSKVDQVAGIDAQIATTQQKKIDLSLDSAYIAGKAAQKQSIFLLNQAIENQSLLKKYTATFVDDAMFAVELNTRNFNDLGALDMAIGEGTFPIWDADVSGLIADHGGVPGTGASFAFMSGQIFDLQWFAHDFMGSDPVQLPVYRKVGSTLQLVTDAAPKKLETGHSFIKVKVAPGTATEESVPEGTNDQGRPFSSTRIKVRSAAPLVQARLGMGAYCGNVRAEVQDTNTKKTLDDPNFPLQTIVQVKKYSWSPRNLSVPVLNTQAQGVYNTPVWAPPTKAHCTINASNYDKFTQDVGSESSGFWFWKEEHDWNRVAETKAATYGMTCTFSDAKKLDDGNEKVAADAARQINEMVTAETTAKFIQLAAESYDVKKATPEEIARYKTQHPDSSKWSPTMLVLCGGEPICTLANFIWFSLDFVHKKTNSTQTEVSQSFHVDYSFSQSGIFWKQKNIESNIGFTLH